MVSGNEYQHRRIGEHMKQVRLKRLWHGRHTSSPPWSGLWVGGHPLHNAHAQYETPSVDHATDANVPRAEWIRIEFAEEASIGEKVPPHFAADLRIREKL